VEADKPIPDPMPVERELGWARGEIFVPEDFDDPLPAGLRKASADKFHEGSGCSNRR